MRMCPEEQRRSNSALQRTQEFQSCTQGRRIRALRPQRAQNNKFWTCPQQDPLLLAHYLPSELQLSEQDRNSSTTENDRIEPNNILQP